MTEISAKSPYHPQSTFLTLFRLAYNRIWKSRALRGWEIVMWSACAAYVALWLHGYSPYILGFWIFNIARYTLMILTPFLVVTWVYRSHISVGTGDLSLKSVPESAVRLLWPRLLAVAASWFQLFIPFSILLYMESLRLLVFWNFDFYDMQMLNIEMAQLFGWVLICITWGFLAGVLSEMHRGSFIFNFFFPLALIVIGSLIYNLPLYGLLITLDVTFNPSNNIWPTWFAITGYSGLAISWLLFLVTCRLWGIRT